MGERRGAYRVLVGKPEGGDHFKNPGVDGRMILKWILETWDGGDIDWIDLGQDKNRWRAVVNTVMNLRVP